MDDDANQMAMLGATVSGEKKIFVHSLLDGKLIAEYSSPFIGFSSNIYHFSAIARRVLVYDKQSTYLMDLESGHRIPFENNVRRGRRSMDSYGLYGRHVISETQIFDAENGKLLFADNSPIYTFRMIIAQTNRVAEVVKSVTATGPGNALVAAPFLTGEVLVKNLEDQSIHQQFQAPTDVHSRDFAILVAFAFWSATWIGYSRIAYSSQGYLICMILYFAILLWLAVYRLENAGLVTQFDRPVKWFLAGLLLGGGTQAALWLWCGAPPFWSRAVLVSLFCAASVMIAKDRVFTRLSSTMDGMLAAVLLVLTALTCVAVYIALRWCYGRWYGLHMDPKTHFSILNLLVCVTMASIIMSVLIPFRKTLLGSVVFEPPASHALLYACSSIPIALILRQLKPRLWCEVLIAFCLLVIGAILARSMFGEMIVSNADAYLSFAGFYASWALCTVACYGQDFVPSPAPNVQ